MDEYRRGVTEKTNFLNSLREAGDDPLKQQRAYGMAGKLSDWVKMQHEQAQTTELGAKTAGHKVKTAKDTQDFMDAAKRNLSINPSDANVVAWGQDAVIKGFATADQAQAEVNRYLSMTPAQRVAELRKAGSSVEQLTPKFQTVQTPGGGLRIGSTLDGSFTTNETLAPKVDANTSATIGAANERARLDRVQRATQATDTQRAQPPVAVVDPITGKQVFVSRDEAIGKRMSPAAAMESLPPKELQRREATYPQATAAIKGMETKSESFIADLEKLKNHPGLPSITGLIAGRVTGLTSEGRAAKALYDKITAKGGFQALQDIRSASTTGGGLGNISNQEGKQLVASFAAIDRTQDADDVKAAIDQAIHDIRGSKTRMRDAYDTTYQYKSSGPSGGGSPTPSGGVIEFGSLK